jgi:hypothetical protein
MTELKDDVGPFTVLRAVYELPKFIEVGLDGAGPLMVTRAFELHARRLNLVLWAELREEHCAERLPGGIGNRTALGMFADRPICEQGGSTGLHERKSPVDLGFVTPELVRD